MFLSGLVISLLLFRFLLRNGKTALKTTVVCSTTMCLGLAVYALLLGELFMAAVALAVFVIVSVYANMARPRISRRPFAASVPFARETRRPRRARRC